MFDKREHKLSWKQKNKQRIKEYNQKYRQENDHIIKNWRKRNKQEIREYKRSYYIRFPWLISYRGAQSRCSEGRAYAKRGILFNMTKDDFKHLWFRDKAYLLKRPSIDRINSKGNYEKSNCRFIELRENLRRRYVEVLTKKACQEKGLK